MDPGSVGVIVAAVPVLLALAGPLQERRRVEPRVVAAAAVVAAGAAAVQGLGGDVTAAGLAAALGALACEAAFSLLAAPLLAPLGPVAVSAWAAILAVPLLLAAGLAIDGPAGLLRAPSAGEALGLAWLTVMVTAVAFVLWYSSVRTLGVERTGLLTGVLPVSALLVAALLGRADLTAGRLAGALLVGAGIAAGLMAVPPMTPGRCHTRARWVPPGAPFPPSPSYGGTYRSSPARRPRRSASNARTTSGSNCVPAPRRISSAAASTVQDSLYGRSWTSTSNTSATCTRRPSSGMSLPAGRRGSRCRPSARGASGRRARPRAAGRTRRRPARARRAPHGS